MGLKQYYCRRCGRGTGGVFMVPRASGAPSTLCLACDAHDRIRQEAYATARSQTTQERKEDRP